MSRHEQTISTLLGMIGPYEQNLSRPNAVHAVLEQEIIAPLAAAVAGTPAGDQLVSQAATLSETTAALRDGSGKLHDDVNSLLQLLATGPGL